MKKKYLKTLLKPKKHVWFYPHTLIPLRCFTAKIYCRVSESCWHDHKLNSDGVLRAHIFSSPSLHVLLGRTYMFQTLPLYGSDTFHLAGREEPAETTAPFKPKSLSMA